MQYYYYIQTNVLCIILLFGIWLAIHKKKDAHPADQTALTRIIALSILICFSDMFGWVCNGMSFPGADIILHAVNMVYYFSTVAVCCEWLCYVEIRIYGTEKRGRVRSILRAAPLCAILVLVIINPVTGCLFSVDEGNVYQRGSLVFLHWVLVGCYMFYGLAVCLRRVLSARSRTERRQYMPLLWFYALPFLGTVLQLIFYGLTTIQCGITLSVILHAYVTLQAQISGDALTGLNNRRALESYLDAQVQRDGKPLSVVMCDVDDFKKINDTLGHVQGDVALKRAAAALKQACATCKCSVFLCRYGGDEFVVCSTGMDANGVLALKSAIKESIEKNNGENPDSMSLSINIGAAHGVCSSGEDAERLLREADEEMYRTKKARGAGR